MLPPLVEVPREPALTRIQMDVRWSVEYPHQVGLRQMRQGRVGLTRWNPPDTGGVIVFGILRADIFGDASSD